MEAHKILIATALLTSLLSYASPFETKSQVSRTIALFAARECKNTTPTGSVKPQKGVFKGKTIRGACDFLQRKFISLDLLLVLLALTGRSDF